MPSAFSCVMRSRTWAVSAGPSAAVGSSMIRILASKCDGPGDGDRLALAARERSAPGVFRFLNRGFKPRITLAVADAIAESSSDPVRVSSSRPRNTLPAASMLSASASFW